MRYFTRFKEFKFVENVSFGRVNFRRTSMNQAATQLKAVFGRNFPGPGSSSDAHISGIMSARLRPAYKFRDAIAFRPATVNRFIPPLKACPGQNLALIRAVKRLHCRTHHCSPNLATVPMRLRTIPKIVLRAPIKYWAAVFVRSRQYGLVCLNRNKREPHSPQAGN
jgi:hypothetical protein